MSAQTLSRDYTSTHVLLIRFAKQDLPSLPGLKKLKKVFQKKYHYEVTEVIMPRKRPHAYLTKRMTKFMAQHNDPAKLLILCYFGHGGQSMSGPGSEYDFKWCG